ncbi:site-specific integrase [Pseudomonas aeruginosa]|uniref:site-specific integrase n=1 Tax=Pseudomonas aeruginosa TaxID=287 RepID=UPI000A5CAB1D|nr:site-specific integrase [Pseudomonas aeruginosa]VEF99828.1 Phage integrase [Pseudomonas aeruginosa]
MAHNLELQGGTYHVRLAVPADVRQAFGGRKVLSQSLKTGVHREAMERRLPILAAWKAQIKLAREGIPPPEGWQDKIYAVVTALDERKRSRKLAIVGEKVPHLDTGISESYINEFMQQNPRTVEWAERLLEECGEGIDGKLKLQESLHQIARQFIPHRINEKYKLDKDQKIELSELISNPTLYKPKSPITKSRLEKFRTFRETRNIAAKTIDQQTSKLSKLSKYLTDTGKPLDFDAISDWMDSLNLSSKTLAQYLLAGNVFWKWAMKYDERWRIDFKGKANPFEQHDLPVMRGSERTTTQRRDFTLDDIKTLHSAALQSEQKNLADLISLGVYTGARIEEICKLTKENLVTIDGVQCFDIADSKTAAGVRVVPIHPALHHIVVRLSKDSTDGYLIQSKSRNKYGIRSDPFVKSFGRLKTSLGFGADRVFHSIRKTVITQLLRASIPGIIIAEIVGHETGTVIFDVYSQGASISQKWMRSKKSRQCGDSQQFQKISFCQAAVSDNGSPKRNLAQRLS